MADPAVNKIIEEALEQIYQMELRLQKIDRNRIRAALDAMRRALEMDREILEALEILPHTELDMRMARLRIQAATGLLPPSMVLSDRPTPVEPLQARTKGSSGTMPAMRGETMPGLGVRIPRPTDPKKNQ